MSEAKQYRIVEDIRNAPKPDWPWRYCVEERRPERQARFLWWSWTVPEDWVVVTSRLKFDQARFWIDAAEKGALRRVVQ